VQIDPDFVPLPERLKAYAREDAIKAAESKVVELPRRPIPIAESRRLIVKAPAAD
jgi:hypothetical protein